MYNAQTQNPHFPSPTTTYKSHFLKPSICNQKKLQATHGYNRKKTQMAYPTYAQNDIRIAVLSELLKKSPYNLSNKKAIHYYIHHLYNQAHPKDFTIANPYIHKLHHTLDFFTYEPTSYK